MELTEYINHPERLDKETLYEFRSLLALYPYFQTARLLLLQNLYLLHDPTFDEELRRAAIYITDRKVIFQLVEAAHYEIRGRRKEEKALPAAEGGGSRTMSLIENFLDSIPKDEEDGQQKTPRKPTPADAAVDYVAYLLESEGMTEDEKDDTPPLRGQKLIDNFIRQDTGRIVLNEKPEFTPQVTTEEDKDGEEEYFTETLARIYVKQGRYSKALEIIKRLSLAYPKKNAYFADQIRFLEKLIINSKQK
ncbi:MAG: tetratricopeptide repeat protein [Prevotella sp.]|jgi:tetratricopeptide (TPR) repeat protein|nr:tetratricopeptide repeat protein [Prevotella sp.]